MSEFEVFVCEFSAVDGSAAGSVAVGEVAALDHELRDDAVESRADVALSDFCCCAELDKVLGSDGDDVFEYFEGDSAFGLSGDGDFKIDLWVHNNG